MMPFLVPGAAFLQQLAVARRDSLTRSRIPGVWNCVVMPHETWALLLLCLVLLYRRSKNSHPHCESD